MIRPTAADIDFARHKIRKDPGEVGEPGGAILFNLASNNRFSRNNRVTRARREEVKRT